MNDPHQAGPLVGITVLDASSVLSGPLAAMLLADMGAEVIKVENPLAPDFTRSVGAQRGGMSSYYFGTNRGKRSLAVNARTPAGRTIVSDLATRVDVVIQNMRPGKAASIGLDPDECLAANPSLVYCSISGFGPDGPAAGEPVYDYVIQATTGQVDLQRNPTTGEADLARHFPADKVTSHAAVEAILGALFARERDPQRRGQHVQVSMHEANLAFFWPDGMMQHALVGPADNPDLYPGEYYRVYPTADGAVVLMPLMSPLEPLCLAVDRPDWLEDPRWAPDHRVGDLGAFQDALADELLPRSTEEVLAAFSAQDVPVGRVIPLDEVHLVPQAIARGSIREIEAPGIGPIRQARPPWRFGSTPEQLHRQAPKLGQDTVAVLGELGYEPSRIQELASEGVIVT